MRFCSNEIDLPRTSGGCWRLIRRGTRSDDFSFPPRRERSPNARGVQLSTGAPAARTISPWLSWGDPRWRLLRCALCDRGVDDDGGGVSLRAEERGLTPYPADGGRLEEKVDPRRDLLRVTSNVFEDSWRKRGGKRSLQRFFSSSQQFVIFFALLSRSWNENIIFQYVENFI